LGNLLERSPVADSGEVFEVGERADATAVAYR